MPRSVLKTFRFSIQFSSVSVPRQLRTMKGERVLFGRESCGVIVAVKARASVLLFS